jgi:hypothetical protein
MRVATSVSSARRKSNSTCNSGAAIAPSAARLLSADYLATGGLQRSALDREVLAEGRDTGITVKRHDKLNRLATV